MNYFWTAIIAGLTLLTAVGDGLINAAGEQKKTDYRQLIGGLVIYVCTGLFWFVVYKHIKFSVSGALYGVMTALVFTLIGIFYFHETIKAPEIIGIVMAILSIFLLSRFGS
jgi:drug/metabolite transporter (DMT)-like permease